MRSRRGTEVSQGFTLVELLVVIAVIAILAAILFPVFSRARAKARQASCESNMHELGVAILMYAQDHGDVLPAWCFGALSGNDNGPAQGAYTWDTVIQPYLKNTQILTCPNSPFGRVVGGTGPDKGQPIRSYAMPRYVGDPEGTFRPGGACDYPCPMDWPPLPDQTVLLMEKGERGIGIVGDAAGENFFQSHSSSSAGGLSKAFYHNEGKNFLFLDGHVKWFKGGSGPFAALVDLAAYGLTEPPAGVTAYEQHVPGHCEFDTDWPRPPQ